MSPDAPTQLAVVLASAPLDPGALLGSRGARPDADGCAVIDSPIGRVQLEPHSETWNDAHPGEEGLSPMALDRAAAQAHLWPEGAAMARAHSAHVRLRLAPADGTDPLAAIEHLCDLGLALLSDPRATSIFFPYGEAVRDGNVLGGIRASAREQDAVPLQAFTNGRIADPGDGWRIADIVGLGQLGAPDHEAAFPADLTPPFEALGFLYDLAHHLVREGGVFPSGMTLDGPGGKSWMARHVRAPLVEPTRPAVRWMPLGLPEVPEALLRD